MQLFLITLLINTMGFTESRGGFLLRGGVRRTPVWVGWGILLALLEHLRCPLVASAPEPLATGSAGPCVPGEPPSGSTTVLRVSAWFSFSHPSSRTVFLLICKHELA